MITIYVPQDTVSCAMGADELAVQLASKTSATIVRNGSRGIAWLEVLVEVEQDGQRVALGPATADDATSIADAIAADLSAHPLYLGNIEEHPYLKKQQRLNFARAGIGDPVSIENYRQLKGFDGLENALKLNPQAIVDQVKDSGLRGRGGAAFPTGIKWQTVLNTQAEQKYIVCNADEGDSGTFADRLLMEADPYQLIEGMTIAGLAVGATEGYIYLRSEYPKAHAILNTAIDNARAAGFLGQDILGSGHAFELEVRLGAGAYICGEETSLLESLEGKRGMVRPKPPLPAIEGFLGQPTVVNNVITLGAIASVMCEGAAYYQDFGMGRSRGTLPFQLAGNIKQGGLVELAFGVTLRSLLEDFGGGSYSGRPMRAVQVGGPLGAYLPESQWDMPMDYETFAADQAMVGHGGIVVFDDTVDMSAQARFAMEFCAEESCGKCTPCRIGSVRGVEVIDKIRANDDRSNNLQLLDDLCDTMEYGSLCAMGGMTPFPVRSAVKYFADDFQVTHKAAVSLNTIKVEVAH